jgi:hypothetical protein
VRVMYRGLEESTNFILELKAMVEVHARGQI